MSQASHSFEKTNDQMIDQELPFYRNKCFPQNRGIPWKMSSRRKQHYRKCFKFVKKLGERGGGGRRRVELKPSSVFQLLWFSLKLIVMPAFTQNGI